MRICDNTFNRIPARNRIEARASPRQNPTAAKATALNGAPIYIRRRLPMRSIPLAKHEMNTPVRAAARRGHDEMGWRVSPDTSKQGCCTRRDVEWQND
jgi:hypothetical protein